MERQLNLTRMSGSLDGESLCLKTGGALSEAATFGRQHPCTVILVDDPEVSRVHAQLSWRDGGWWLEDLGSSNGTFVGEFAQSLRISGAVRLSAGQIFRVGRARFRLEAIDEQNAASATVAALERS